jgi:hypothetical protein
MKSFITLFLTCFSLTTFAQTAISITGGSCYPNTTAINQNGTTNIGGTRYTYTGNSAGSPAVSIRVIYTSTNGGRWELQYFSGSWLSDYYNTSQSIPKPPDLTLGTWVNNTSGGCANLTQFSGTGTQATLPVELTTFDAQNTKGSNRLAWSTASEKNNEGFDIERSVDGTAFQKIGFVKGNGTTNQPQQYTYTDALVGAVTYYRLKQVDTDGKFEYSKVVSVESNGDGLRVYPTLVSDGVLTVQGGQSDDCIVTNLLGQPVWMGKTTQQLDVSMLPKGTYLLKVGSEVTQFVKQ